MSKRVNESQIDSHLKTELENEVVEMIKTQKISQTASTKKEVRTKSVDYRPRPEIPVLHDDPVDKSESYAVKDIPVDEKPKDLYNRITQLKATMEVVDETTKKKLQIQKQQE